jgi:hypothetical protein
MRRNIYICISIVIYLFIMNGISFGCEVYADPCAVIYYPYDDEFYIPAGDSRTFHNHSYDGDEGGYMITDYKWWFYDNINGFTQLYCGEECEVYFPNAGFYQVWLEVWDDDDGYAYTYRNITVYDATITMVDYDNLPFGTGMFFYYNIIPDTWWDGPDDVYFQIIDWRNEYRVEIGNEISLEPPIFWDGKGNYVSLLWNGAYLPPREYWAILSVYKNGDFATSNWYNFRIVKVESIEWKKYTESNPDIEDWNNGKEDGKKIFPDKKTYDDGQANVRKRVTVEAQIYPPVPNVNVYFSWWDIDDPSTTDPDGSNTSGPDNYGAKKEQGEGFLDGSESGLVSVCGITDSQGKARVTFVTSMQPGDNFKITAACSQDQLNQVTQTKADSGQNLPLGVVLSQPLTVWRHLWIEQDSMDQVATSGAEQNYVSGTGATYSAYNTPQAGQTTVYLHRDLPDGFEDEDQFEYSNSFGGWYIAGGQSYQVVHSKDVWQSNEDYVVVNGDATGAGSNYDLYDDDDQTLLDSPHYCSLGTYANAFHDAFIEPTELPEFYRDVVDFDLNLTDSDIEDGESWDDGHNSVLSTSSDFWFCSLVACYQGSTSEDSDPVKESPCLGASDNDLNPNTNIAAIFIETIRDYGYRSEEFYVAHEIGHTGGADHGTSSGHYNYIMGYIPSWPPFSSWDAAYGANTFHPDHIVIFRSHDTWLETN